MTIIAAFGDVDIDLFVDVGEFPRPGDEVFAKAARTGLGGSAVNTAVRLVRLGFDAMILAQVGDDAFGRQATSTLERTGVDTSRLTVSRTDSTGMNVLMVTPDGERTMVGLRGANTQYPGSPGWETEADWLHMSGYALLEGRQRESAEEALACARTREIPISIDIPSGVARVVGTGLGEALGGATIVSVGREPLSMIFPGDDAVGNLLATGVDSLAVTAGGDPFSIYSGDETLTLRPPPVEVVDTTAAGDAFIAGLIAGTLRGLGLGPQAVLAAALGAAATRSQGAGNEQSGAEEVVRLLHPGGWPSVDEEWLQAARAVLDG